MIVKHGGSGKSHNHVTTFRPKPVLRSLSSIGIRDHDARPPSSQALVQLTNGINDTIIMLSVRAVYDLYFATLCKRYNIE